VVLRDIWGSIGLLVQRALNADHRPITMGAWVKAVAGRATPETRRPSLPGRWADLPDARYLAMQYRHLMGGSGTILGAVVGAALIEIIRNSLTLLGISTFWQGAFVGTFIVVAVAFDSVRRARRNAAG
jgi:hypothetical protein